MIKPSLILALIVSIYLLESPPVPFKIGNGCSKELKKYLKSINQETFNFSVKNCKEQVVAGTNFQMRLKIEDFECQITIFRDLNDVRTINTSFPNTCPRSWDVDVAAGSN